MATVNQVFPQAPMGRRVILTLAFIMGVLLVFFCGNLYVAVTKERNATAQVRVFQTLAPVFPIVVFVATFFWDRSRTSQFRIEDNVLVLCKKRYPLEGLTGAVRDTEVLCRARRRPGRSGVGSVRGRFRSKRLGEFEAFLTDPAYAVVLTWPDRVVAVSPADPEFFIYSARAAAGLR